MAPSFFLLIAICFTVTHCVTLSQLYRQIADSDKEDVLTPSISHPNYHRTREIIGTLRGKPIYNRQHSGFIDANGVPVPVLPYARTDSSGFMRGR
uniref:Secreted protein n=1 Tax=Steinernema glaseri TaxID=37863 RepID=A0A1I7ZUG3_9BILA